MPKLLPACWCNYLKVEILSDSDGDDEEDINPSLSNDKYRPQSFEKMVSLVALLVESSRGVDGQLHLPERDLFAIIDNVSKLSLSERQCLISFIMLGNFLTIVSWFFINMVSSFVSCVMLDLPYSLYNL